VLLDVTDAAAQLYRRHRLNVVRAEFYFTAIGLYKAVEAA
jgi:hypothetical protein